MGIASYSKCREGIRDYLHRFALNRITQNFNAEKKKLAEGHKKMGEDFVQTTLFEKNGISMEV